MIFKDCNVIRVNLQFGFEIIIDLFLLKSLLFSSPNFLPTIQSLPLFSIVKLTVLCDVISSHERTLIHNTMVVVDNMGLLNNALNIIYFASQKEWHSMKDEVEMKVFSYVKLYGARMIMKQNGNSCDPITSDHSNIFFYSIMSLLVLGITLLHSDILLVCDFSL